MGHSASTVEPLLPPMKWIARDIVSATGGDLLAAGGGGEFPRVRIDSRTVSAGDVFIAIEGPRFDGHDFVADVIGKGAGCLVVSREKADRFSPFEMESRGIAMIAVDDTVQALGSLAAGRRKEANIPVVAVTGSTGKTTTREMITCITRRVHKTLSTVGNLNNEIGLPLTLLNLAAVHRLAVLELGMNHPGEIRRLSAICEPDIGVITNIGPAHLEGLRDVESVARAKGEMLENIRSEGTAVLNADDEYARKLAKKATVRTILFGRTGDADIRAEGIIRKNDKVSFTLLMPGARVEIDLNVYGEFMVQNALAAAAAAHQLGIGAEEIKSGLESFHPVEGRMLIYETPGGIYIIDDTYNANPMSMEAAIHSLSGLSGKKRGILVAGDMLELGEASKYYHERIGRIAGEAGIDRLYLTGSFASQVAGGARNAGMGAGDIFVGSKRDIVRNLSGWLRPGDWVLVKGSRSTGMEEIVRWMTKDASLRTPVSETQENRE